MGSRSWQPTRRGKGLALDLPITPFLPDIAAVLRERRCLVLSAETGAGKSTLVPPYLLAEGLAGPRRILMLEPRRIAAAAVSARISEILGSPLGEAAGYHVRGDRRAGSDTSILVLTEGILVRMIQDDPLLEDAGLVIFDEFHERSVHADLGLALIREVRRARPDLALLVMSATMNTGRVAAFLDGAPVLSCSGRAFPVDLIHRPIPEGRGWEGAFAEELARLAREETGDILAFLPGMREIKRVEAAPSVRAAGTEVLILHGSLPLDAQREILRPAELPDGRRRIILSTSIAETSLTVPGIRVVADSGWTRTERFHPRTGMNRLVTERVSGPSAEQRRGRAGRLGPGVCVRFWPETTPLRPELEPEIIRSDLSGLVLECALWGALESEALAWLDPPPPAAWKKAKTLLRELGAIGDDGRVTEAGRKILLLGLAPRLGAVVLRGRKTGTLRQAALIAAVLGERESPQAPDFRLRLEEALSGAGGGRRSVLREAERIAGRSFGPDGGSAPEEGGASSPAEPGVLLAAGYPDRVAKRNSDGSFSFVSGRRAVLPRGTAGELADAGWIVAPAVDPGETIGIIRLAAPLTEEEALACLRSFAREETIVVWKGLVPRLWTARRAGRLGLSPPRPAPVDREAVVRSFLEKIRREGTGFLPWTERSMRFLARLRAFHLLSDAAGDLDEAALAERAEEWLVPYLDVPSSGRGRPVLTAAGLLRAVEGLAGPRRRDFEAAAPDGFTLPTGAARKIDYMADGPAVDARIQEIFGLRKSPLICGRPLTFRLLSPANRPLQITRDLESFWRNTYPEVRREMRGRYPKHNWPEDPLSAPPSRRPKPKG